MLKVFRIPEKSAKRSKIRFRKNRKKDMHLGGLPGCIHGQYLFNHRRDDPGLFWVFPRGLIYDNANGGGRGAEAEAVLDHFH